MARSGSLASNSIRDQPAAASRNDLPWRRHHLQLADRRAGAGAVAGGLYAARSGRTGIARLTRAALFYAIAVGLVAAAPSWPAAVAACVVAGAATITFLSIGNATIQLAAEPEYRGRVTALWSMALVGSTAIGSPVIGVLSDVAGPRYALALGAVACLAAVAIGRWLGGSRARQVAGTG